MGMIMRFFVCIIAAGLALGGCDQKLSGIYVVKKDKANALSGLIFQKIEFGSGDTVDLTATMGQTLRGTYKVDGKKVVITVGPQSSVFLLDDQGCIDGGDMIGKFCKS